MNYIPHKAALQYNVPGDEMFETCRRQRGIELKH
jgi:hypothetical protein